MSKSGNSEKKESEMTKLLHAAAHLLQVLLGAWVKIEFVIEKHVC